MKTTICPSCESDRASEQTYSRDIDSKGKAVRIDGFRRFVCPMCEAEFSDDDQSRYNLALLQRAQGRPACLVSGAEIRAFRESIGITQREAARVFGGGMNAFSKYENAEIVQTEAMDNLLWIAINLPGIVPKLASRRSVILEDKVKRACGEAFQISFDVVSHVTILASSGINSVLHSFKPYVSQGRFHGDFKKSSAMTFETPANDGEYQSAKMAGA